MQHLIIMSIASGYGGAEKGIELMIKYLKDSFNITVVLENNQHYNNIRAIGDINIIKLETGNGILETIKNLMKINKLFANNQIFLSNTNKSAFYLAIFCFFGRIKSENITYFVKDFQWKYMKFINKMLKKSNCLIPSAALTERDFYLDTSKKIYIIPECIESLPLTSQNQEENYILIPAMISRLKGMEYIIKSLPLITDKGVMIVIVGKIAENDYFLELKELIKTLGVNERIEFIAYTNDLDKLYRNCRMVCNTSVSTNGGPETFGRTIIEAWSYKKPVIAFSCGGPKTIIDNNIDGLLVAEGDVLGLANAINTLNENEYFRKELGINGRAKVEKYFLVNQSGEELKKILSHA